MECQRRNDYLISREKTVSIEYKQDTSPSGNTDTNSGGEKEGRSEIDFGSTHPIVLRYQVTRSSLISHRQVGVKERERKGRRRRQFPVASSEDERPPRERRNFSGSGAGKRY